MRGPGTKHQERSKDLSCGHSPVNLISKKLNKKPQPMPQWIIILITTLCLTTNATSATQKTADAKLFQEIFSTWTSAFNRKDLDTSCGLFAKNVSAHYQGTPPKTYTSICNGFKKIFQEPRHYEYRFELHDIYRENNLAAVRVTWHLRITEQDKLISEVQDEGLDIFQRNEKGEWKIVNYLGYPVHLVA
jgi:ketosteroid isomerase-like protein